MESAVGGRHNLYARTYPRCFEKQSSGDYPCSLTLTRISLDAPQGGGVLRCLTHVFGYSHYRVRKPSIHSGEGIKLT